MIEGSRLKLHFQPQTYRLQPTPACIYSMSTIQQYWDAYVANFSPTRVTKHISVPPVLSTCTTHPFKLTVPYLSVELYYCAAM